MDPGACGDSAKPIQHHSVNEAPISAQHQPPRIGFDGVLEEIIELDGVSGEAWMTGLEVSHC